MLSVSVMSVTVGSDQSTESPWLPYHRLLRSVGERRVSFCLNHNCAAQKPLGMCFQTDFARFRSRLDNHLRQAIEHASLPNHRRGFAGHTEAHTLVDATRPIGIMYSHRNGVVARMKELCHFETGRSLPIMRFAHWLSVHIHPSI